MLHDTSQVGYEVSMNSNNELISPCDMADHFTKAKIGHNLAAAILVTQLFDKQISMQSNA